MLIQPQVDISSQCKFVLRFALDLKNVISKNHDAVRNAGLR